MPVIQYQNINFSATKRQLISVCNQIIDDYTEQGFQLTLRQLYYQLVRRNVIPNQPREYANLGNLVSDARLAGLIDWNAIEDRTRNLMGRSHWDSPSDIIRSASSSYFIDLWQDQEYRPEVWVEKDALSGVLNAACNPLDVPYFACKGYTSQSAMWEAGQRLLQYKRDGYKPIIFHLGDHDPSGIDMSRDIQERLEMFTRNDVIFHRIALTMAQVEESGAPPNPAKTTDSRFRSYLEQYGDESWELDALQPKEIVELVQKHIRSVMNGPDFDARKEQLEQERAELKGISDNYKETVANLSGKIKIEPRSEEFEEDDNYNRENREGEEVDNEPCKENKDCPEDDVDGVKFEKTLTRKKKTKRGKKIKTKKIKEKE